MKRFLTLLILLSFSALILAQSPGGTDQSLLTQGLELKDSGKFIESYDVLSNLKVRFPDSPLLAQAEYQMGLTLLYDQRPVDAAIQFQQVISKHPSSEQARMALNLNAILYRLYIAPATDKRIYVPDSAYTGLISELGEPSGMAIDRDGKIYVGDRNKKFLYSLDPSGRLIDTAQLMSPGWVSVTPKSQILIGNDTALLVLGSESITLTRINPDSQQRMGPLEGIRSGVQNEKGEYFVVSSKSPGVAVFDAAKNPVGKPSIARTEELSKVDLNSRGYIHVMNRKGESLAVFDPQGKQLFTISKVGSQMNFGKMEDFAVDPADHIYVLTDNPKGVIIYSPQGKFLKYLASDRKSSLSFEDGKLICVGAQGSIYVLDKSAKRILKIG